MARPDPALLDPARYPFSSTMELRFGDLDVNLHVNNVAMAGIIEDARVRFHRANGFRTSLQNLGSMVASNAIEYLKEVHYPDPIRIYSAIEALGRTSHTIVQLLTQNDDVAVFAKSVMVGVGPQGPVANSPAFLEQAAEWMLRP